MHFRYIQTLWLALAFLSAGVSPAVCAEQAEYRLVSLDKFMRLDIAGTTAISIPVPAEYDAVNLPEAPFGYSYWMRPSDAEAVVATGDLPAKHGYMYGKTSLDVGFDAEQGIFLGAEDQRSRDRAKQYFSKLQIKRADICDHPVLLVKLREKGSKKYVFAAYISPDSDMNVFYIAVRPANNSKKIGDKFFDLIESQSIDSTACASDSSN